MFTVITSLHYIFFAALNILKIILFLIIFWFLTYYLFYFLPSLDLSKVSFFRLLILRRKLIKLLHTLNNEGRRYVFFFGIGSIVCLWVIPYIFFFDISRVLSMIFKFLALFLKVSVDRRNLNDFKAILKQLKWSNSQNVNVLLVIHNQIFYILLRLYAILNFLAFVDLALLHIS